MAINSKWFIRNSKDIPVEKSIRFDIDFTAFAMSASYTGYRAREIFEIIEPTKIDFSEIEEFNYCEIGNVTKTGDANPVSLSFSNRNEENENYFKKILKGDIIKPMIGDILLSSVRPNLNKNILIEREDVFFTKAFIQIRPKINSRLFYHSLRTIFFKSLIAVSREGKGYPTLKDDDLRTIIFERKIIDALISNQKKLEEPIHNFEIAIRKLKSQILDPVTVIDKVFAKEFNYDLSHFEEKKTAKNFSANLFDVANDELKFDISLKSKILFEEFIQTCRTNGLHFKPIRNNIAEVKGGKRLAKGQNVIEEETPFKYVRVDDLSWDGSFDLDNVKYITEENQKPIARYISNTNDILLTIVGATVGKCGLVPEELDGQNITENFARLIVNQELYIPQFLTYCFQSKIVQYQIDEYTGKGSQGKLAIFRIRKLLIPDIELKEQQRILNLISSAFSRQKEIEKQIEEKQTQISKLIEKAIMN